MTDWFYADTTHARRGPVPATELLRLYQARQIDDRTLVWRDGLAEWVPLDAVRGEFASAASPAPAASEWTLEALAPAEANVEGAPAPGDAWRPVTESAHTTAVAPAGAMASASPYAPPTAPVAGAAAVVRGGPVFYAGFWKRVAAYLIDGLVVGIIGMVIGGIALAVLGGILAVGGSGSAGSIGFVLVQVLSNLLSIAIGALYYAWFHASNMMATPGKMAVGIKVVRSNGERISLLRGIGRYFSTILSALILMIGFLMIVFTERRQSLHDIICDTVVVDKWAFTDRPDLQHDGLGTVAIVVLAIFGALFGLGLVAIVAALLFASM
ncbi:RDD family protein [Luteimonas sp. TWI1437]|uniref:RDD family protein n=1 Tax=unclassified Luteimonas TaxID=2629088 RepID=UPI0032082F0B